MFKIPQNDKKYEWTHHAIAKMGHYRLVPSLVKRIIRFPHRTEEGIAPGTTAVMQKARTKRAQEFWVMYRKLESRIRNQELGSGKLRIISAWRYPGVSPLGKEIPIPEEIRRELEAGDF